MKNSILKKANMRIKTIINNFKTDNYFSTYYAFLRLFKEFASILRFKKIVKKIEDKRNAWISSFLKRNLIDITSKFQKHSYNGEFVPNSPIWICWWTGEDTAPPLVKQCIKSIRCNSGNHPVNFIDKDSYSQYISIPDYMLKKVEEQKMGLAHLSDYIRISLLEKHGGLWLDATIFSHTEIPESYFTLPFFTCKSERQSCGYISEMRWCTFVLGGWKNNIFFETIKSLMEEYWKKKDYAIDYLFFDHLINLANENIPSINELISNVPINNIHRDDLQASMNKALPTHSFFQVIQKDTVLYKLSWRESYNLKTIDGEDSIYHFFITSNIDSLIE